MIEGVALGFAVLSVFALAVGSIWGLFYRGRYKTLMKAFKETRLREANAERVCAAAEELAHHRKIVLDNVLNIILAEKNQVPKSIKMMVVTETKK